MSKWSPFMSGGTGGRCAPGTCRSSRHPASTNRTGSSAGRTSHVPNGPARHAPKTDRPRRPARPLPDSTCEPGSSGRFPAVILADALDARAGLIRCVDGAVHAERTQGHVDRAAGTGRTPTTAAIGRRLLAERQIHRMRERVVPVGADGTLRAMGMRRCLLAALARGRTRRDGAGVGAVLGSSAEGSCGTSGADGVSGSGRPAWAWTVPSAAAAGFPVSLPGSGLREVAERRPRPARGSTHAAFRRRRIEDHFDLRLFLPGRRAMHAVMLHQEERQNSRVQSRRENERNRRPVLDDGLRPHHRRQDRAHRNRWRNVILSRSRVPAGRAAGVRERSAPRGEKLGFALRRLSRRDGNRSAHTRHSLSGKDLAENSRSAKRRWRRIIARPFAPGRSGLSSGRLVIRGWGGRLYWRIMAVMRDPRKTQRVTQTLTSGKACS